MIERQLKNRPNSMHRSSRKMSGFSILELLIVISLVAVVYLVALPNLNIASTTSTAAKLGQVASDIRAAFDMSVLHRRPYRLVFELMSGDYWLETTDKRDFAIGDHVLGRDLTKVEEEDRLEAFDAEFEEYVELAGTEINDSDNERVIPPSSPVLQAKKQLRPAEWKKVEDQEWSRRSIGPELIFQDFRAEHHDAKQTFADLEEEARAMLYFLPGGHVEKAVIHIAYRLGENEFDSSQQPYTLTTNPYLGTAEIVAGYEEVEIEDAR